MAALRQPRRNAGFDGDPFHAREERDEFEALLEAAGYVADLHARVGQRVDGDPRGAGRCANSRSTSWGASAGRATLVRQDPDLNREPRFDGCSAGTSTWMGIS